MRAFKSSYGTGDAFVVFADIAIALSFLAMVYAVTTAVTSSKEYRDLTRDKRQKEVRDALLDAVRRDWREPGARWRKWDEKTEREMHSRRDKIFVLEDGHGLAILRVDENGSFQRVRSYDMVFYGDSYNLTPEGERFYSALASVVYDHRERFEYLLFHGMASTGSSGTSASEDLSAERARAVREWIETWLRKEDKELQQLTDGFYADYGTGAKLTKYCGSFPRVDIILFYNDGSASGGSNRD